MPNDWTYDKDCHLACVKDQCDKTADKGKWDYKYPCNQCAIGYYKTTGHFDKGGCGKCNDGCENCESESNCTLCFKTYSQITVNNEIICNKCSTKIDYKNLAQCNTRGAFIRCIDRFGRDTAWTADSGDPTECKPCKDPLCNDCNKFFEKCNECGLGYELGDIQNPACHARCGVLYCAACNDDFCSYCQFPWELDDVYKTCVKPTACDNKLGCINTNNCGVFQSSSDAGQDKKSVCVRCHPGWILDNFQCNRHCSLQIQYCMKCAAPKWETECQGCRPGFRLVTTDKQYCIQEGKPLPSGDCKDTYGKDTSANGGCLRCAQVACKSCKDDYNKCSECQDQTDDQRYLGLQGTKCNVCFDINCVNCKVDYFNCTKCLDNYNQIALLGTQNVCQLKCSDNCNCSTVTSDCSTCVSNYGKDAVATQTALDAACPKKDNGDPDTSKYHKDCPTLRCVQCKDPGCDDCQKDFIHCDKCLPGYSYNEKLVCSQCGGQCKTFLNTSEAAKCECKVCYYQGIWNELKDGKCQYKCEVENCTNCEKYKTKKCIKCNDTFGFDPNATNSNKVNCKKCEPAADCLSCPEKFDTCVKCKNPLGTLVTINGNQFTSTCKQECHEGCICDNTNRCTAANNGYGKDIAKSKENDLWVLKCSVQFCDRCQYDYTKCDSCIDKYSIDKQTNNCLKCQTHPNCLNWHEAQQGDNNCYCIECKKDIENLVLKEGECVFKISIANCKENYSKKFNQCKECNDGYAWNNTICKACQPYCEKCDRWACFKCQQGYRLDPPNSYWPDKCVELQCLSILCICYQGKCLDCKQGAGKMVSDQTKCASCIVPNCAECFQDYTKCTSCENGYTFDNDKGNCTQCGSDTCLDHEDDSTTQTTNTTTTTTKSRRFMQSKTTSLICKCKKCAKGYNLDNGSCMAICSENCAQNQCTYSYSCRQCIDGFGVLGGQCVACKDKQCVSCANNADGCQTCQKDTTLKEVEIDTFGTLSWRCVASCPQGAICSRHDGKPTRCLGHEQFGKNTQTTRRLLQNTALQGNFTCTKCDDDNCKTCEDNYKICNICALGFDLDTKNVCSKCAKKECEKFDFVGDDNKCVCQQCKLPANQIEGECVFTIKIENCAVQYSNEQNMCPDCLEGFRIDKGKCQKCGYQYCLQCDDDFGVCELCPKGYYIQKFISRSKTFAFCKELSCANIGCVCSKGECQSCNVFYGKQFTSATAFNCVTCVDKGCNSCPDNYLVCKQCLPGWGLQKQKQQRLLQATTTSLNTDTWSDGNKYKCSRCAGLCSYSDLNQTLECQMVCKQCAADHQSCEICHNIKGLVLDEKSRKCLWQCGEECELCWDTEECRICKQGYYRNTTLKCSKCTDAGCARCSKENDCQACTNPLHIVIPPDTVKGEKVSTCKPDCKIFHRCGECEIVSNQIQCNKCQFSYGLSKAYNWSLECSRCTDKNCVDCGKNNTVCVQCVSATLFKIDDTSKKCVPVKCPTNCKVCSGLWSCDECELGFGPGQFSWVGGFPVICQKCSDINCVKCTKNSRFCEQCDDSYKIDVKAGLCQNDCKPGCVNNQCVSNNNCKLCKDSYGLNKQKNGEFDCEPCKDKGCRYCAQDYAVCCSCTLGIFKMLNGKCQAICDNNCQDNQCDAPGSCNKDKCKPGFYQSTWGNGCWACTQNCTECASITDCKTCGDGFVIKSGRCTIKCDVDNCQLCNQADQCSLCYTGFHLDNDNKCINKDNCDKNFCTNCDETQQPNKCQKCKDTDRKLNSFGYCEPQCESTCWYCSNPSTCLLCKRESSGLLDGKCSCPIKNCTKCNRNDNKEAICDLCSGVWTYRPSEDKKQCNLRCRSKQCTCAQFWQCDGCIDNYQMGPNNICIPKCQKRCNICDYNDPTKCLDCQEGFGPDQDKSCVQCKDSNCASCSENIDRCINCIAGWGFKNVKNLKCEEAAAGLSDIDHPCTACQALNCSLCYSDSNICEQCAEGWRWNVGLELCAPTKCIDHCDVCVRLDSCMTCNPGYGLQNDNGNDICIRCTDVNCFNCNLDANICNKCKPNNRVGLDSEFGTCRNCPKGCQDCLFDYKNCNNCSDNWLQKSDPDNSNNKYCQRGSFSMANCKTADKWNEGCTECETGFIYHEKTNTCDKIADCNEGKDGCEFCNEFQVCVSCKESYQKDDKGNCVLWCDKTQDGLQGCVGCGEQNKCTKCQNGYTLQDNKCQKQATQTEQAAEENKQGGNSEEETNYKAQSRQSILALSVLLSVFTTLVAGVAN